MALQPVILVVDDEPQILNLISEVLEDAGYHVEVAGDGREALDRMAQINPHLILLDLMMPRMDGYTFRKMLGEQARQVPPVVVVSADRNVAQKVANLGINGYLPKPFDLDDLLGIVERYAPQQHIAAG